MNPIGLALPVIHHCNWDRISSWTPPFPRFVRKILLLVCGTCTKMGTSLLSLFSSLCIRTDNCYLPNSCARWADNGVWLMNDGEMSCGAYYTIELNQQYPIFLYPPLFVHDFFLILLGIPSLSLYQLKRRG